MTYENISYETIDDGTIGIVTLSRPKRANAMSQAMLVELDELCTCIADDKNVRCVIVTGAGGAFSAGFDLSDQAAAKPKGVKDWVPLLEADFRGIMSFWNLPQPTIAAVNGPALASGFEMMLGCDLTVSSDQARFGEPELKFGAGIVAMILPWFVGPKVAREIIYTGNDGVTAQRAKELGLVNHLVDKDEVMERAESLARDLARMDPMVLRRTKMAMNRTYEIMGMRDALRSSLEIDMLIEGEGSELKTEFLRIIREKGLKEALAWRESR